MKIPFKFMLLSLLFILFGVLAFAEGAEIVKQDGRTIYFDISMMQHRPLEEDTFAIILLGEEIINPKTGKVLGREEGQRITGRVIKIKDLYAIGVLDENIKVLGLTAEFKSDKQPGTKNPIFLETEFPAKEAAPETIWQSAPLPAGVRLIAACDLDGDKENEVALSFDKNNEIKIFKLSAKRNLEQVANYYIAASKNILAMDCADIKNDGKHVLFVSVFNGLDNSFNTFPFTMDETGLNPGKAFKGLVQGIAPYNRQRVIYTQKVVHTGKKYNLTKPARLLFENGHYTTGDELPIKGLNIIFGFNMADLTNDGLLTPIYITKDGKIRAQFDNPKDFAVAGTGSNFAASPNIFMMNGGKQQLYLPLAVFKNGGDTFINAVQNFYGKESAGANLYFLKWTGSALSKYKVFHIPGRVYDMKQAPLGPFKNTLLIPYDTSEKSILAVYAADNI